jgi:hypothetical protein
VLEAGQPRLVKRALLVVVLDCAGKIVENKPVEEFCHMPSLIRFLITLLFLGALVYGGMFALSVLVEPREKEVSVRVPARDLFGN